MASAIEYWKHRIEAQHVQSLRKQEEVSWPSGDSWEILLDRFKADPHRTDDPVVNLLRKEVPTKNTMLDVGGGAGKFALPLALQCRQVTVVEPSSAMVEGLQDSAKMAGINNLSVVQESWEDAVVEPADIVLCAHVVYGVANIEPFIRKLECHARERVLILAHAASPLAQVAPFWQLVHGEERADLPTLPELLPLLWEMDIFPDVRMLPKTSPESIKNREVAIKLLRHLLYVEAGTELDRRLTSAAHELLAETPAGLVPYGAKPRQQGLISWRPDGGNQD